MNSRYPIALAVLALALAACQGSFGSGGGTEAPGGVAPPVNAQMPPSSQPMAVSPHASSTPTTPPGNSVTYAVSDAAHGVRCPQDQGFSCTLQFTALGVSPSPSASGSSSPSPSPTPTPTPTPLPSGMSPSASASPSPTPSSDVPHVTLTIAGLPKNAPKMNDPDPKAVATIALVTLRLRTDTDVTLTGTAAADFTLPQEQIGGRGFAVQLYHEVVTHRKTNDRFVGSYAKSKVNGTTLSFELPTPSLQIKKNETWLLVLYGDELPSATTSPKPSPSSSPRPTPSASPTPTPSAGVSPATSPSVSP
jgi:hypothetical protein